MIATRLARNMLQIYQEQRPTQRAFQSPKQEEAMNKATALTREKSAVQTTVNIGNDKVAVGAIGIASLLIGCWAVVCLTSGVISSGGPIGLVSNLLTAISG